MSRLASIQDRKKTRSGFLLILASLGLLVLFAFVGIKYAGNVALFTEKYKKSTPNIQTDKTPPGQPRLDTKLPEYTNIDTHTLEGYAEAGASVKIYRNEVSVAQVLADGLSKYSVRISLEKRRNEIWATATDIAGNESDQSPTRVVTLDQDAPEIEVLEPKDGDTVTDKSLTVKGKTEAGSQITANERLGSVNSEGDFTVKISLIEGENVVKTTAEDRAGNKTEKEFRVTYEP